MALNLTAVPAQERPFFFATFSQVVQPKEIIHHVFRYKIDTKSNFA
ncbi:MAG: hypothetical protein H6656_18250 [Ardenticatenaceae bacterium]|nr:hypothetical protein [Ardenticatenaceae bacterium]